MRGEIGLGKLRKVEGRFEGEVVVGVEVMACGARKRLALLYDGVVRLMLSPRVAGFPDQRSGQERGNSQ